jgi:cellobiose phosphorylase
MKQREWFKTKYGCFSGDGGEYVITAPETPRPWINVICNGDYGLTISQAGGGYSWRTHAQLNRLTRWEQDILKDEWGKFLYIRDERKNIWSAAWKPVCAKPDRYRCRHGIGYTTIESGNHGIDSELTIFVPNDEPLEVWKLTLRNRSRRTRRLSLFTYFEWGLGAAPDWHREFHRTFIETGYDARAQAILATKRLWEVPTDRGHWNADWPYTGFHSCSVKPVAFDTDKESVLGRYGSQRLPAAVGSGKLSGRSGKWLDAVASLQAKVALKPGEHKTVCFTLGAADSRAHAVELAKKYRSVDQVERSFESVRRRWAGLLGTLEVSTPDRAMNFMANTWLKYQTVSGRIWGRTAYYQTGGAYGFRDQLQDSQVWLPIDPARTKDQILLHARHQFKDGTVYHWWHPITEIGLHNQVSDNLLWLPFVMMSYLRETADFDALNIKVPFVDDEAGSSLYEHCTRAIDRALQSFSSRGLPLIGAGDWNDGLSAVGLAMKGESIWLGHFLHHILTGFSDLGSRLGDRARAELYRTRAGQLKHVLNEDGWDGGWYYRATKDSGVKLGSRENKEGKIFLNAQTWAVIAGVAEGERARTVLRAVEKLLEYKAGPLLLYPAYTTPDREIGYLTRYAPGVRENGGVYTHAATWAVIAETVMGRGESAYRMASKINPIHGARKPDEYCAEPYVTPGNIDGPDSPYYGRGGWTWYTGSAAWLFRAIHEYILGVRPTYDGLLVDPCIPRKWTEFAVCRQFRGAVYNIHVRNPSHVETGIADVWIDNAQAQSISGERGVLLPVFPAGTEHLCVLTLGRRRASS